MIEARKIGSDACTAIDKVIEWSTEAIELVRLNGLDYAAMAVSNHAMLRRIGPLFLNAEITFETRLDA